MSIHAALGILFSGKSLSRDEMQAAMSIIMEGNATPAQIGAFLAALRVKGETVDEITGAVSVLRQKATFIQINRENLVDTCGTGGDGSGTFNISTAAAIVASAAGVAIAKHGNQAVTSSCGSANVLTELGLSLDRTPEEVGACIEKIGIGFLFAPKYHTAMRYVGPIRQELKQRTLFNLLGPMLNPAGAKRQLMGVYAAKWLRLVAETLQSLGSERVMVVHADDGLDEISLCAPTRVVEVHHGVVSEHRIHPSELGLTMCTPADIQGGDAQQNAQIILDILKGVKGPKRDIITLNAAAAIMVGGLANQLKDGLTLANKAIDNGSALKQLEALVSFKI